MQLSTLDLNILEKVVKYKSSLKNDDNDIYIITDISPEAREQKKRVRYLTDEEKSFACKEYESGKTLPLSPKS